MDLAQQLENIPVRKWDLLFFFGLLPNLRLWLQILLIISSASIKTIIGIPLLLGVIITIFDVLCFYY